VVIGGNQEVLLMFYLYICLYREFFGLVKANFKSVSEVSKFHVNSLSIVCHTTVPFIACQR